MTCGLFETPDIIVVGAGLAGLSAALTAAELNFKPLIVEAEAAVGGTSALSDGVFNAFDPERQILINVNDSPEKHLQQLLNWGANRGNRALAKVLCYEAPTTLKWLEHLGLQLPQNVVQAPSSPYPRSHIPDNGGRAYIELLYQEIQKRHIAVLTSCKASGLLRNDEGFVNGICFKHSTQECMIHSRYGVVLATGGFCRNRALLKRHCPILEKIPSKCVSACDGTMMLAAADFGAALTHMSYFVWDWQTEGLDLRLLSDTSKYILLNSQGKRFVREDVRRRDQIEATLLQPQPQAWLVSRGSSTWFKPLPFSEKQLQLSIASYNRYVGIGRDEDFNKSPLLLRFIEKPYQIQPLSPSVTISLGGICIDAKARVIDRYGKPIQGLTAAGDITGGIHGEWAARGDCLASAAVFGRIAAFTLCKN